MIRHTFMRQFNVWSRMNEKFKMPFSAVVLGYWCMSFQSLEFLSVPVPLVVVWASALWTTIKEETDTIYCVLTTVESASLWELASTLFISGFYWRLLLPQKRSFIDSLLIANRTIPLFLFSSLMVIHVNIPAIGPKRDIILCKDMDIISLPYTV